MTAYTNRNGFNFATLPITVHRRFDPRPQVLDLGGRAALRGLAVSVGLQQAREDEAEVDLDDRGEGDPEGAAASEAAHHEGEERLQEEARVRH